MDEEKAIAWPQVIFQEKVLVWSLAVLVPLVVAGPQLAVGSFVNALLFYAAFRLKPLDRLPVIVLPSLAAFGHGLLFGGFSWYLFYFLPFIWLGNYVLVEIFSLPMMNDSKRVVAAASLKSIVLFAAASLYFGVLHIVPAMFLTAMGIVQLITAILGGIGFMVYKSLVYRYDRNGKTA